MVLALDDGIDFFLWETLGSRFQIRVGLFCHPQHELDVLVGDFGESRVDFLWLLPVRLPASAMSDHGHADASQAVCRVTHDAMVAHPKQSAHLEHGLGETLADYLSLGFRVHAVVEFAGLFAESLELVIGIVEFIGGGGPA
ncbi:MAG: hypothetical protein C0467_21125 [Planctomycetaceae bacterium]|nr:hypothetical protein [Planctomycetaceae bacterium]